MSDSKQNEPMTRERLEESAVEMLPHRNSHDWQSMVTPTDALAHGDERYEAGLMEAARLTCPSCGRIKSVPVDEPFRVGDYWRHAGGINCAAGPIHDLVRRREEQANGK